MEITTDYAVLTSRSRVGLTVFAAVSATPPTKAGHPVQGLPWVVHPPRAHVRV